ncbi:DUF6463 family protein [Labrys neptuniae]
MIKLSGWLIIFFGAVHTAAALTVEGAAWHLGTWFSGALWGEDFTKMSPAHSALWFSLDSFGIPLALVGATVLWLDRRGITPPAFIAWSLGVWTLATAVILLPTPWPILLLGDILLLIGIRRKTAAALHGSKMQPDDVPTLSYRR